MFTNIALPNGLKSKFADFRFQQSQHRSCAALFGACLDLDNAFQFEHFIVLCNGIHRAHAFASDQRTQQGIDHLYLTSGV